YLVGILSLNGFSLLCNICLLFLCSVIGFYIIKKLLLD
ncbi:uncharacterized protein METZ01_LOCUS149251, partial [marine metagenome]